MCDSDRDAARTSELLELLDATDDESDRACIIQELHLTPSEGIDSTITPSEPDDRRMIAHHDNRRHVK